MAPPGPRPSVFQSFETWLWTGPIGHFVGATIDLVDALARHLLARARAVDAEAVERAPLQRVR